MEQAKSQMVISVRSVAVDPVEVTVAGIEGGESSDTAVVQGASFGGGRGGGRTGQK